MPSHAEDRLSEMRFKALTEAQALAKLASGENRAFTVEECAVWEALNGELDLLDKRLALIAGPGGSRNRLTPAPSNPDYPFRVKINYSRQDPPPVLPAGCWHLIAF